MAFIDLGAPFRPAVSGAGSEQLAQEIGGVDVGSDTSAYEQWVHDTRRGQVAPECGARVLEGEVAHQRRDDFGELIASRPGSGSI